MILKPWDHSSSDSRMWTCKDDSKPLHPLKDQVPNLGRLYQEAGSAMPCPSGQFLLVAPVPVSMVPSLFA